MLSQQDPVIELVRLEREEVKLLKFIRTLGYGSIELTVQDGKPVLIKQAVKTIKL